MTWVNDLASGLGLPAAAATIAVAMYSGCAAAEKVARPEALRSMGGFLKNPSWERSASPTRAINNLFKGTFGDRHFSLECACRSAMATAVIAIALGFYYSGGQLRIPLTIETETGSEFSVVVLFVWLLWFLIPDYISLGKTRLLLSLSSRSSKVSTLFGFLLMDIVGSFLLSFFGVYAFFFLLGGRAPPSAIFFEYPHGILPSFLSGHPADSTMGLPFMIIANRTTLFTSLWAGGLLSCPC